MAKNRYRVRGRKLNLRVADINGSGAGNLCKSGDPGVLGGVLPCVVLTDEDEDGNASVDTLGVYKLDVHNESGGDLADTDIVKVYWDNTAGELTTDATGNVYFGIKVGGAVDDTETSEIEVRVGP